MPRTSAATWRGTVLILLALLLSACGVRIETPPAEIPSADSSEQARAAAVTRATWIATSAQNLADEGQETEAGVLSHIASGASQHASQLGGQWSPPPRPTPAPTAAIDPPASTAADLIAGLVAGYEEAREGAAASTGDQAVLLSSVALWRAVAAHELAAATGAVDPATLPAGGVDETALALSTLTGGADLARGLDAAAFGYETLAARSEDDARLAAWNARAAQLRDTGDVVASAAGIAGGTEDPREAVYDVADLVALPADTAAATIETNLAALWIQAPVPPELRGVAIDAALASMRQAATLAPRTALDEPAGLLPGLTVPTD